MVINILLPGRLLIILRQRQVLARRQWTRDRVLSCWIRASPVMASNERFWRKCREGEDVSARVRSQEPVGINSSNEHVLTLMTINNP